MVLGFELLKELNFVCLLALGVVADCVDANKS